MEMQCNFCYASETEGYYFSDNDNWLFCCFICAQNVMEPIFLRYMAKKGKVVVPEKLSQAFAEAQDVLEKHIEEEKE